MPLPPRPQAAEQEPTVLFVQTGRAVDVSLPQDGSGELYMIKVGLRVGKGSVLSRGRPLAARC